MSENEHALSVRAQMFAANCEQLVTNLAKLAAERDELKAKLEKLEPVETPDSPGK